MTDDRVPNIPPPGSMGEAALGVRELFVSFIEAGFSEYQACVVVGTWLAQSGQGGTEDKS